jgi:hypothetical protein
LKVRENLLTSSDLAGAHEVQEIFLDPLPNFDQKKLQGVWLYEKTNPFPSSVAALEVSPLLPIVVQQDQERIFRDKATGKVILAVYRNHIGPDALEMMGETIIEMMQIRRKVARSQEIKKLNQGNMAAAGYTVFFNLVYI